MRRLTAALPLAALFAAAPLPGGPPETAPVRVTTDRSFKSHLHWSPDGQRFLFTRIHQGQMALWTVRVDGSELQRVLPAEPTPHFDGSWSPDGKRIVFVYDKLQGTD